MVLEEWRLGLGAQQRVLDKSLKILFKGSRYAERLTIRLPEIIKGAPREALTRFYKDWYRPDLMAVIAVGDFPDAAAVEQAIVSRFGDLAGPRQAAAARRGGVPRADGTRVSLVTDREMPVQIVAVYNMLAHRSESTARGLPPHRRRAALPGDAERAHAGAGAARRRAVQAAFASVDGMTREIDAFARTAIVKAGKIEDALRACFAEVLRVEQHGFTATGIRPRAREPRPAPTIRTPPPRPPPTAASSPQEITRNFFEGELAIGREAERDLTLKVLPLITLAELNALARSFGGAENRVIGIVRAGRQAAAGGGARAGDRRRDRQGPDRAVGGQGGDGAARWRRSRSRARSPRRPRSTRSASPTGRSANGVRVIVKPTDFEKDAVTISGQLAGRARDGERQAVRRRAVRRRRRRDRRGR